MTPTQILTDYYGRAPTAFEVALYNVLGAYLNRAPTDDEIGNMKTDSNLIVTVLSQQ